MTVGRVIAAAASATAVIAYGAGPAVDVYEVYTELTVPLRPAAAFTCEAGGEPHTLVLTVAADAPGEVFPGGRIGAVKVVRAKGATTYILTTTSDAGTFRAYAQKDPPAVIVDVYRRLQLTPPKREDPFRRILAGEKVLLVDDDDGPGNGNQYSVDVDARYREALARLNVAVDVRVVRTGRDGPAAEELTPYPFVIWFTGLDARPVVISAADEAAMSLYLARGGRLVLVSQNYLSDASRGRTAFCRDALGLKDFKADTQVAAVTPGPAAALDEDTYDLGGDGALIGNWGDGFRAAADAQPFFVGPDDGWFYGTVRKVGAGRLAFFSCAVENVGYAGRRAEIIAAALNALAAE